MDSESTPSAAFDTAVEYACNLLETAVERSSQGYLLDHERIQLQTDPPLPGEYIEEICTRQVFELFQSLTDHFSALRILAKGRNHTSLNSIGRSALENASLLRYLIDPNVSLSERVRRSLNHEIKSWETQTKFTDTNFEQEYRLVVSGARALEIPGATEVDLDSGRYSSLGKAHPRPTAIIDHAMESHPMNSKELGRLVYGATSSAAHGQSFGYVLFYKQIDGLPQPFSPFVLSEATLLRTTMLPIAMTMQALLEYLSPGMGSDSAQALFRYGVGGTQLEWLQECGEKLGGFV